MSQISEKNTADIHLWEEYLIFAEAFGITKKINEKFDEFQTSYIRDIYEDCFYFNKFNQ